MRNWKEGIIPFVAVIAAGTFMTGPALAQSGGCGIERDVTPKPLDEQTWKRMNDIYEDIGEENYDLAFQKLTDIVNRGKGGNYQKAIDIYTTSILAASKLATVAAARIDDCELGAIGVLDLGPVQLKQRRVTGPDGLSIVLVETANRRSSLLDDQPQRLCSEVHSVVWTVTDTETHRNFWAEQGFAVSPAFEFESPGVSDLLDLPRASVPARMCMISDADVRPIRLELLEFTADLGDAAPPPPAAGIWGMRAKGSTPAFVEAPGGIRLEVVA